MWGTAVTAVAWVLAIIGILIAIGAHPTHVDLSPAPASTAEQQRQDVAVLATRIAASTRAHHNEELATQAEQWAQAAGGVWVPWPSGAPSGYTNPVEATSAAPEKLTADLASLRDAAITAAPAEPLTYRSIAVAAGHALAAQQHQGTASAPAGQLAPIAACGPVDTDAVARGLSADALARFDAARQWFEAAAGSGKADKTTTATRVAILDAMEEAALTDVRDARSPFAALPASDTEKAATETLTAALLTSSAPDREVVGTACALTIADSLDALPGVEPENTAPVR